MRENSVKNPHLPSPYFTNFQLTPDLVMPKPLPHISPLFQDYFETNSDVILLNP